MKTMLRRLLAHVHMLKFGTLAADSGRSDGRHHCSEEVAFAAVQGVFPRPFSEFLGVQSKCQSNFNYGSENIRLEMEFVSKVIKNQSFLKIFAASVHFNIKIDEITSKIG